MAESGNGKASVPQRTPNCPSTASDLPGACAEEELILTLQQVEALMERAVNLSARIGPEWENVVSGIQTTLLDSLLELEKRLRPRVISTSNQNNVTGENRTEGKPDDQ